MIPTCNLQNSFNLESSVDINISHIKRTLPTSPYPIICWILSQDRIDLIAEKGKSNLFDPAELNSSISFYQGALIGNGAKC